MTFLTGPERGLHSRAEGAEVGKKHRLDTKSSMKQTVGIRHLRRSNLGMQMNASTPTDHGVLVAVN